MVLNASQQAGPQGIARLQDVGGLGRFVRSLVGLDREAAKRAFGDFMTDRPLTADQLEFLDVVIDYLTERGLLDPRLLYKSPFTDFDSNGVEGVFPPADVILLVSVLRDIEARSAAKPQWVPTIHQARFRGEVRKHLWRAVRPIAPSTSTGTSGRSRMQEPSWSHSRPRGLCLFGTFSPSRRQMR